MTPKLPAATLSFNSLLSPYRASSTPSAATVRQYASGKSKSSKEWLSRQGRDPFVKQRTEGGPVAGFRARSAFKLMEINERFKQFLSDANVVVDLGAAPGGWTQVVAKTMRVRDPSRAINTPPPSVSDEEQHLDEGPEEPGYPEDESDSRTDSPRRRRTIIAVDLLPIKPIPGVHIIQGDFLSTSTQDQISSLIPFRRNVDVVLSDMSPNISGNRLRDVDQSLELCSAAFTFAKDWLASSKDTGKAHTGVLVMKYFEHPELQAFRKEHLQTAFHFVQNVKPSSSRSESSEAYWVCSGFRRDRL